MFDIAGYLQKFKKFSESRNAVRIVIQEALEKVCGVQIDLSSIDVKNGIARIKGTPALKNELVIKKQKILAQLSQKTSDIKDIQ